MRVSEGHNRIRRGNFSASSNRYGRRKGKEKKKRGSPTWARKESRAMGARVDKGERAGNKIKRRGSNPSAPS